MHGGSGEVAVKSAVCRVGSTQLRGQPLGREQTPIPSRFRPPAGVAICPPCTRWTGPPRRRCRGEWRRSRPGWAPWACRTWRPPFARAKVRRASALQGAPLGSAAETDTHQSRWPMLARAHLSLPLRVVVGADLPSLSAEDLREFGCTAFQVGPARRSPPPHAHARRPCWAASAS